LPRRVSAPVTVFLLLGLVSLTADMTYEGARSVGGAVLEYLGAGILVAGVAALGELLSGIARYAGGVLAYRSGSPRAYWGLVFAGYAINLLAAPALALAGSWQAALLLLILERIGKGVRGPARDSILAEVSEPLGRGAGFGIHEVLDQAGAIAGPLMVWAIASGMGLRVALAALAIPAVGSLALLSGAYALYPAPRAARLTLGGDRLPGVWIHLFVSLSLAGLPHWALVSYIVSGASGAGTAALLYAVAMFVDALSALLFGITYDRAGALVLLALPISAISSSALILRDPPSHMILGAALWGVALGVIESPVRAFVADSSDDQSRSLAFSILGLSVGLGWGIGTLVQSILVGSAVLPVYSAIVEGLAFSLIATGLIGAFNNREHS